MENNLFTSAHNWTPEGNASKEVRITLPDVYFSDAEQGDFAITAQNAAIDAASTELYALLVFNLWVRDTNPDTGAIEYAASAGLDPTGNLISMINEKPNLKICYITVIPEKLFVF